jgi:hypothetical protein
MVETMERKKKIPRTREGKAKQKCIFIERKIVFIFQFYEYHIHFMQ